MTRPTTPSGLINSIEPAAGASDLAIAAHEAMRETLVADLREIWDPTFIRLRHGDGDPEAAYGLCLWLAQTAAAYDRDAKAALETSFGTIVEARARLLRKGADRIIRLTEDLTGEAVPDEVAHPPAPSELIRKVDD